MPDHQTRFEGNAQSPQLSQAILLYGTDQGRNSKAASAFATIHPVHISDKGQAEIGAGSPLTKTQLRAMVATISKTAPAAPEILPGNVLVHHKDVIAWWRPASVRTGYFNLQRTDDRFKALREKTLALVPYPAHLFVATPKSLQVFALKDNIRPKADTVLYYSPILNVFTDAKLCWGNVEKPKKLNLDAIPDFEAAVFDSWSTHANQNQNATIAGKLTLEELWDDLAHRKATTFPVKLLKPRPVSPHSRNIDLTLKQLLAQVSA